MTNHDFIKAVTDKTMIAQKDVREIIRAAADVVLETLENDRTERISFSNLGFFKVKHIDERNVTSNLGDMKGNVYTTPAYDEIVFIPFSNHRILKERADN